MKPPIRSTTLSGMGGRAFASIRSMIVLAVAQSVVLLASATLAGELLADEPSVEELSFDLATFSDGTVGGDPRTLDLHSSFGATGTRTLAEALDRIETLELLVDELRSNPTSTSHVGSQAGSLLLPSAEVTEPFCDGSCLGNQHDHATHFVIYESGWTLRPRDPRRTPFELRFELHNQFRYTKFDQEGEPSDDSAGEPRTVSDRNDFDINRGRIVFAGYAFDPALGFYVNVDYSTVAEESFLPLLAWISYQCTDTSTIYFGLGKVPGTWEWDVTSRYSLGVDRSLATTFFRPSISAGIWVDGEITDGMYYTAFVGDGYNTLTIRADDLDTRLAYSALSWWEPLGDFGVGFSDLENHQTLAARIGHGLTHTRSERGADQSPGPEGTVFRLTDGTRLTAPNALRQGDQVTDFDVWLYTAHLGLKRRGCSLGAEYYFRWLRDMTGTTGQPFDSLFDHGFFAQAATFVSPQSVEAFVRGSTVTGEQGTGHEISLGVNWYLFNRRNARATLEITEVDDSPAQQSRTGFVAGGSGTLIRTQLWTFF